MQNILSACAKHIWPAQVEDLFETNKMKNKNKKFFNYIWNQSTFFFFPDAYNGCAL